MRSPMTLRLAALLLSALSPGLLHAQLPSEPAPSSFVPAAVSAPAEAAQVARILGLEHLIERVHTLEAARACGTTPSLEELAARQYLLERVETASLDVDSALSEISSEQTKLTDLRSRLQNHANRTAGYLNAAALITGSGVGVAVNATQLSSSTASAGDIVGISSGAASTLLSILALRKVNGSAQPVGEVPNMLAPLFDRPGILHTGYAPSVLAYLHSVPPETPDSTATRLAQLKAAWVRSGALPGTADTPQNNIALDKMTRSEDTTLPLTISDLTNRTGMLSDVAARVALMRRDLATLMRSISSPCELDNPDAPVSVH
jgi:hypothetical protein